MLNAINAAINTKILLAILGVLGAIGALLIHQQREVERAAAASAKAATALQQQQRALREQQQQDDAFKAKVEAEKRKHSSSPANESKTWQTYRP
jgi:type II secretory pathway pseudopilin PulG